jgi:hypothetical protein
MDWDVGVELLVWRFLSVCVIIIGIGAFTRWLVSGERSPKNDGDGGAARLRRN